MSAIPVSSPPIELGDPILPPGLRRRRIIERPRLIKALDDSPARIKLLIAGPGYGKTTLLEQWAAQEGREMAWYRATKASSDVAVASLGIAAAAREILPGVGARLATRLAVTADPEVEAELLGELLAQDLSPWPSGAWLVIDDYQLIAAATAAEAFVHAVIAHSPVCLALATDRRPAWAHRSMVLDGRLYELTQPQLAFTARESDELLSTDDSASPGVIADGWPIVLGLARMTEKSRGEISEIPDIALEILAGDLLEGLDLEARVGLVEIADLPPCDRQVLEGLMGADRAQRVLQQFVGLGLIQMRDDRFDLHEALRPPILRAGPSPAGELRTRALKVFRESGEWDAAWNVALRNDTADLGQLLTESVGDLLAGSRVATLEQCILDVVARTGQTGAVRVAQAEIALRRGEHIAAQALAQRAVDDLDGDGQAHALCVAGSAAHVGSREERALQLFEQAEAVATSDTTRGRARWGYLVAAAAIESPEALTVFETLAGELEDPTDPELAVRVADKQIALGMRFGSISTLDDSRRTAELLPQVSDVLVRCSFRSTYSCALNLAADYSTALAESSELVEEARALRVDFALPYGELMRAAALSGLRQFDAAHAALVEALDVAVRCNDQFGQQGVYCGRVRAFLHEGRIVDACALEPPSVEDALPSMRGEVLASRGLALASLGRVAEARSLASAAASATRGAEAQGLAAGVNAVAAVKLREPTAIESMRAFVESAYESGCSDVVVTAYRSNPDLLDALTRNTATAEITGYVLARAQDLEVARALGVDPSAALDPLSALSAREREIYELVCQGLSNPDIAKKLFISTATVKLHVQHLYDKLGFRSRTALALSSAHRKTQPAADTETGSGM